MNDKMNVGVWIDHDKAVIVSASGKRVTVTTLESDVLAHPHFGGQQDGGGEKKYEERHEHRLEHYYDQVVTELGHPEALVVFGPGEAKLELKAHLSRIKRLSKIPVDTESADRLTEPQIVAKVKQYFRLAA
jgi:hypothetical protein